MVLDRVNKIKSGISIYTNKKTSNILDGTYKSVYKGKSLNFEDLREYVPGDNIKDIDWKASARNNNLLVKQFIAEKKHNIILVFDSSKKMLADTSSGEPKKEIALLSLGTIGYLAQNNGDYIAGVYNKENSVVFYPFRSSLIALEQILANYEGDVDKTSNDESLEKDLEHITKYINRKSIIFIASDIYGMSTIGESTLKRLSMNSNILFVEIGDAELSGERVFDVETNSFSPRMFLNNKKLLNEDRKIKEKLEKDTIDVFNKYAIPFVKISSATEVVPKIFELLEKHKNAKRSWVTWFIFIFDSLHNSICNTIIAFWRLFSGF